MSDLIDRQKVIDAFDLPIFNIKGKENAERVAEYLKAVLKRIKELPSAWTPCSERLPEKRQNVLVTVNDRYEIYTETDEWTGTGFWAYGHGVIAWMPLPEPYREGEQNE